MINLTDNQCPELLLIKNSYFCLFVLFCFSFIRQKHRRFEQTVDGHFTLQSPPDGLHTYTCVHFVLVFRHFFRFQLKNKKYFFWHTHDCSLILVEKNKDFLESHKVTDYPFKSFNHVLYTHCCMLLERFLLINLILFLNSFHHVSISISRVIDDIHFPMCKSWTRCLWFQWAQMNFSKVAQIFLHHLHEPIFDLFDQVCAHSA